MGLVYYPQERDKPNRTVLRYGFPGAMHESCAYETLLGNYN